MLYGHDDKCVEVKVTKIGKRWHARLVRTGHILDEMACSNKRDIGYICREMLRWFSKLGGVSKLAESARRRQKGVPVGTVWHWKDLEFERLKKAYEKKQAE